MFKVSDYNPDDGDWFWVKYSPTGKADKFGKPKGCVGCHGTRAANDFILVHELITMLKSIEKGNQNEY